MVHFETRSSKYAVEGLICCPIWLRHQLEIQQPQKISLLSLCPMIHCMIKKKILRFRLFYIYLTMFLTIHVQWMSILVKFDFGYFSFYKMEWGYTVLPLSVCSKIVFSATIDGRNLIFGHKLHIPVGTPYRGKRFLTRQIPTSCLPTFLIFIHI